MEWKVMEQGRDGWGAWSSRWASGIHACGKFGSLADKPLMSWAGVCGEETWRFGTEFVAR